MALLVFIVLLTAAAVPRAATFDEFLFDQFQQRSVRCAGQSSHELSCTSGLCFDSLHLKTNIVSAGCASPATCVKSGCTLDETNDTFICCCAHSFCNGKSTAMVQASWENFARGDYGAHDALHSLATRDVSTPQQVQANASIDAAPTTEQTNFTVAAPTSSATSPSPKSSSLTVAESTTVAGSKLTSPTTPASKLITTTTAVITTSTITSTSSAVTRVSKNTNSASTISTTLTYVASTAAIKLTNNVTTFGQGKPATTKKIVAKVAKASVAPRANVTRPTTKRVQATTRRPSYVVVKSLNATTKPRTVVRTAKPTPMPSPKTTPLTVINDISDAPMLLNTSGGAELPEYRPRTPPSPLQFAHKPIKNSKKLSPSDDTVHKNIVVSSAASQSNAENREILKKDASKLNAEIPMVALSERTTHLPSTTSDASAVTTPRRRHTATAYRSFPWYFVVIFGFLVASAIFALIVVLLRRYYPRVRHLAWSTSGSRHDSQLYIKKERASVSGETTDGSDDGYAAYSSGIVRALTANEQSAAVSLLEAPKTKREPRRVSLLSAFRFQRRATNGMTAPPLPACPLIKSSAGGATNDSLASHCTTMTTLSTGNDPKAAKDCELTVIDPLLGKQYTGTIHISPAAKNGKH